MSKMIQIRHIEDKTHSALMKKAKAEGMSLSDFLKREIRKIASKPSLEELTDRILNREKITTPISAAKLVRAERNKR